ncbi:MAG: DUF5674 family protein [Candidatus Shapirobacteria bacterium]|nr:DUF5674 family protein [Candidatus Shapirobacteria bacterium]
MSILKIDHQPTLDETKILTQEYPDYIKLSADIKQKILYGGSRLHYDCEQILISKENSKDEDIWSGGVNLKTKKIEYTAVANIKPSQNNSGLEILDLKIREEFKNIVKNYFPDYE